MIKTVIENSKKIEALLSELNAEGKGLREKTESIKDTLGNQLVRKLHNIGKIRNQVIHGEENFELPRNFEEMAQSVISELKNLLPKAPDEYQLTIQYTKKLENALTQLGAEGKSIHEKVTSVEERLPESLLKKVRYIASVRNSLMHDDGYVIADKEDYFNTFREVIDEVLNTRDDTPHQEEAYSHSQGNKQFARFGKLFFYAMLVWSFYNIYLIKKEIKLENYIEDIADGENITEAKEIQKVLSRLGYYHGKIDGIYGRQFEKAIKDFQINNNIKLDDEIGIETYLLIQKSKSPESKSEEK